MSGNKNQNRVLILLLSNLFIAFLGIGLVIPVMPTLMRELKLDGAIMGYLVSAFAVAQLLFSPFAGKWVDLYGRKPMIIIGMFLFGISELIFGLGEQVWVLFFSRILGGISAAFIMPAVTAFIADITTIKERPKALGICQQPLIQDLLLDLESVASWRILVPVYHSILQGGWGYSQESSPSSC